jgi:hypothetical protein
MSWSPFAVLLVAACGTAPDPAPQQPNADPQPFSQIMKASSTTKDAIGVVQWWTTQSPNGGTAVAGVDASRSVLVEFVSDGSKSELRTPNGTFDRVADGKTVHSTRLSADALRTLELLKADLTPYALPDANGTPALNPASVPVELHPTDSCPGSSSLVKSCQDLIKVCDSKTKDQCLRKSAAIDIAKSSAFTDCQSPDTLDSHGKLRPDSQCAKDEGAWDREEYDLEHLNCPSGDQTQPDCTTGCFNCGAYVWKIDPINLLNCPHVVDKFDWFFWDYQTCNPTP